MASAAIRKSGFELPARSFRRMARKIRQSYVAILARPYRLTLASTPSSRIASADDVLPSGSASSAGESILAAFGV